MVEAVIYQEIQKVAGFSLIYQAECFPDEVRAMFGKNTGEIERYLKWLYTWLSVLDSEGMNAWRIEYEYKR